MALLPHLPAGFSEIYCHPSVPVGFSRAWAIAIAEELAALVSPRVRERIAELGIRLVDLPRAGGGTRGRPSSAGRTNSVQSTVTRQRDRQQQAHLRFAAVG